MKKLLFILTTIITTTSYCQLYNELGRFDLNEAYKHYEFVCEKYTLKDLQTSETQQCYVVVTIDSTQIEFSEEGNFYFTMPVNKILARSNNGKMYTLYVSDEATFAVKWNALKAEYYFEYQEGTNPYNGFSYTLFETTKVIP